MKRPKQTAEFVDLRRCWRRWTDIVELYARRRRGRRRVDSRSYAALHRRLLDACRSMAETTDEARRAPCEEIEDLARPWLALSTFERADREILLDLLLRCRRIEGDLGGWRWAWAAVAGRVSGPPLLLAAVGGLVFLLAWGAEEVTAAARDRLGFWAAAARLVVWRLSTTQKLFVATVAGVAASMYAASRAARS